MLAAVLLLWMAALAPNARAGATLTIESDGAWEDWQDGARLYERVLHRTARSPLTDDDGPAAGGGGGGSGAGGGGSAAGTWLIVLVVVAAIVVLILELTKRLG